ncbi:protein TonB [Nitrosospira sp. Nl5]|uniref:energy transducer TonB n=1 Tax=Nitrosospira sp. Nl5 TaxID=200120 RepID=UPI00088DB833|nr:energy transducer TonB [Nitrosospira sp. Nl5]SCY37193.1 protein TonB [Nitrosospira sp. Nl5]
MAILVSVILHAVVLFGVAVKIPLPRIDHTAVPLEVVLVNSKSPSKPGNADALAQANLNGGGNTDRDRRVKTPLPAPSPVDTATATQKAEELEQEAEKLMNAVNSDQDILQAEAHPEQFEQNQNHNIIDAADLVRRSFEIARVEAQTAHDYDAYQKRPKRRFIGARTQEYRFARYVEDWRIKVERIGNMNYPESARREKLYGNLQLTVGIRSDGSLESLEINRSSGKAILDEAAIRIVKLAGQNGFSPFPPDISRDTDVLHITRTWAFTRSDELTSQ